jgi:phosphoglycolate phosphatase
MIVVAAKARDCILLEPDLHTLFDVFLDYYRKHIADRSRPYPHVPETLDDLLTEGATLAVCTNKIESHAKELLEALDLSRRFTAVTGRDTLGSWKPDARAFTGTVAMAGGSPASAIMVGDSETDINTAKAAGVPVIAVDFGYSVIPVETFEPDIVISDYRELRKALGRASQINT